jgi:hypothetical protein
MSNFWQTVAEQVFPSEELGQPGGAALKEGVASSLGRVAPAGHGRRMAGLARRKGEGSPASSGH